jgi:hypothetical protein
MKALILALGSIALVGGAVIYPIVRVIQQTLASLPLH